jgi:hypothetical protein
MEFPPTGWEIFEEKDFETASPRIAGDTTMELMAQIRPNGRVVDHWRVALGGGKILTSDIRLEKICGSTTISPFKIRFQSWPKDVILRRNMTSSKWFDGLEMLARREFVVFKDGSDEACEEDLLLQTLAGETDINKKSFAVRFGVTVGADRRPRLELQGLPASATTLESKPAFIG